MIIIIIIIIIVIIIILIIKTIEIKEWNKSYWQIKMSCNDCKHARLTTPDYPDI